MCQTKYISGKPCSYSINLVFVLSLRCLQVLHYLINIRIKFSALILTLKSEHFAIKVINVHFQVANEQKKRNPESFQDPIITRTEPYCVLKINKKNVTQRINANTKDKISCMLHNLSMKWSRCLYIGTQVRYITLKRASHYISMGCTPLVSVKNACNQ